MGNSKDKYSTHALEKIEIKIGICEGIGMGIRIEIGLNLSRISRVESV